MDERDTMDSEKEQIGNIGMEASDRPYDLRLVRMLNDALRRRSIGGEVFVTREVDMLPEAEVITILRAVACFDDFTEDNDPCDEHDCAVMNVGRHRIIWKIDYYDQDMRGLSSDPADPQLTRRVMTIMLASEY